MIPTPTSLVRIRSAPGGFVSTASVPSTLKSHPIVDGMLAALKKDHMLDISLVAKDGTKVKTSRFVMACRVESMEEKLFPDGKAPPHEVSLEEYSATVLEALVEYCFCGELITSPLCTETTHESARGMVELAQLASSLNFKVLGDETYQWARRMMNRNPSLACTVYEVAINPDVQQFENYAFQTITDNPKEAFLGEESGIQHLSPLRLQNMFVDHDMEEDEIAIFDMLQTWFEKHNRTDESLEVARKCANHIQLRYIDTKDLLTKVKNSGFFDQAEIDLAAAEHDLLASHEFRFFVQNRGGKDGLERVEVQGAGVEEVNGTYYRQQDRDGETMFSKGEGPSSIGLFKWEKTWGIGPSSDLSNMYYSCQVDWSAPDQVPIDEWTVSLQGETPAPSCNWIAANSEQDDGERYVTAGPQSDEELDYA